MVEQLAGQEGVMFSSENKTDVIIVGSGIVGIACAHYLSKTGMSVRVIDRGTISGACSHGNCGYICPSHVLPLTEPTAIKLAMKSLLNPKSPFRVRPRLSPAMWNWFWQFTRRCNHRQMLAAGVHLKSILDSSMVEYRRLMAEESIDCEWKESGLLYVLQTEAGIDDFSKTNDLLTKEFGVTATRIEGQALPQFDPSLKAGLAGAFFYPGDASVRPDKLSMNWSNRLREHGVDFVEQCELTSIERVHGKISHLQTSHGKMTAEHYVIAAGAWSTKLAKELDCRVPIEPGKGYSVTMRRPARCPKYPMLFPEHKVGVTPFDNGYRLGSMMEFVGFDATIPKHRIAQLRSSAEPYLIDPHTDDVEETWFGWRPMTWDSLPIIGQVPRLSNAFFATGHNMLGLSLAAATGRLLSELMLGNPPHIDPIAFSPVRFQ